MRRDLRNPVHRPTAAPTPRSRTVLPRGTHATDLHPRQPGRPYPGV